MTRQDAERLAAMVAERAVREALDAVLGSVDPPPAVLALAQAAAGRAAAGLVDALWPPPTSVVVPATAELEIRIAGAPITILKVPKEKAP